MTSIYEIMTASEARGRWRHSNVCNVNDVNQALRAVHRIIKADADRGENDAIVEQWRDLVPSATVRNYVIRTLEDREYDVEKEGSRLIITWRQHRNNFTPANGGTNNNDDDNSSDSDGSEFSGYQSSN